MIQILLVRKMRTDLRRNSVNVAFDYPKDNIPICNTNSTDEEIHVKQFSDPLMILTQV